LTTHAAGIKGDAVGTFVLRKWAPLKGNGFRVNAPVIPERYRARWEGKQTGVMRITLPVDPAGARGAELYLELWGGHPGTAGKRFTLNGHGPYDLPEVGTERHHCTYSYPTVRLDPAHLWAGENVLAFTCDSGNTFWPHYLIRAACVRQMLEAKHPTVAAAGLADFSASVAAEGASGERIALSLKVPPRLAGRIAAVEYHGRYRGFDENGDRVDMDWHGFTKDRRPVGIIARAEAAPFEAKWDVSMLPDQDAVGVRAVVHFKDAPGLVYETPALRGVAMPPRGGRVRLHYAPDCPRPFWSRANRPKTCRIDLGKRFDPARVARAQLHVVIWDGGKGGTEKPFTLNRRPLPVAGAGRHDVLYRVIDVDPKTLRPGANEIRLLSDTDHHGIELLAPGPGLVLRTRR
jgi:hypothetical protein